MSQSPSRLPPIQVKQTMTPNRHQEQSPVRTFHTRNSSDPPRITSPATHLDRYWSVTESGCLPAFNFAFKDGHWWGGKFTNELAPFEQLVEELPSVIENKQIEQRVNELPEIDLFASASQKTSMQRSFSQLTGPGHADTCSINTIQRPVVVLHSDVERERAFALFAYIANAYIFSKAKQRTFPTEIRLPARISVSFLRLSLTINRLPITDYACSVLNNWELIDISKEVTLENVRMIRSFTGTEAEKWFFAIHSVIEYQGGKALLLMVNAQEVISKFSILRKLEGRGDKRGVALQNILKHAVNFGVSTPTIAEMSIEENLEDSSPKTSGFIDSALEHARQVLMTLIELKKALEVINMTMSRLSDKCPPEYFYESIRPWVASWPDPGVIYESYCNCGYEDIKEPRIYSGASGAQSSLLPSIDGFLGIAYGHRANVEATPDFARTDLGAFIRQLKSFRNSMPPAHREMVNRFETQLNVRDFVDGLDEYSLMSKSKRLEGDIIRLKTEYNNCIEMLSVFRRTHNDYATKYIKSMAAKKKEAGPGGAKGTGGSDFAVHLARHITDTRKSLYALPSHS